MLTQDQQQILTVFGSKIVERLKDDIRNKRVTKFGAVNASGDLADSVRFEVDQTGLRVFALDYILFVNDGRRPGKFPPREAIKQWIQDKNLSFDIPINSLAFLIGRKIAKQGTTAWQQGGTDLVEGVITDELIREITQAFADDYIKSITSEVLEAFDIAA